MGRDDAPQDKAQPTVGIMLTALSVLLIVGILTFAAPCEELGGMGQTGCRWASRAVCGMGVALLVISVVRIFERDEGERRGLSFSAACVGALVACTPAGIIGLCADTTMPCQAMMLPFVRVVAGLIALVGAVDLVMRLRALTKR